MRGSAYRGLEVDLAQRELCANVALVDAVEQRGERQVGGQAHGREAVAGDAEAGQRLVVRAAAEHERQHLGARVLGLALLVRARLIGILLPLLGQKVSVLVKLVAVLAYLEVLEPAGDELV